jgi:Ca2+-binding RTX toxin-like protein
MNPRAWLAGLALGAGLLLAPAQADAERSQAYVAFVPGSGAQLDFGPSNFGDTESHDMEVRYVSGEYRLTDSAGVEAGADCVSVNPTTATCGDSVSGVAVNGGGNDDTIVVDSMGPGDESGVHGFRGNDRLVGFSGVDWLVGYAGNDSLDARGGPDRLLGGPSQEKPDDDVLDGGPGPDYISGDSSSGGVGRDTVLYSGRPASEPVTVTLTVGFEGTGGAADDGGSSDGSGDTVEYVENVVGGAGDDFIIEAIGDFGIKDNVFRGGPGDDRLIGGDDSDQLIGEAGLDRLKGGRGADRLSGGGSADLISGEDGPDVLAGDGGGDRMLGGPKRDRLTGGPGADFMKGLGQKDLIFARDNTRDRRIDCGPGGRREAAQRDRIDPPAISC